MTKDQIIDLVLELYTLRKDSKDYFEFFLNPDINNLYNKYLNEIVKELRRTRSVYRTLNCAARITRVKKTIKAFDSFGAGKEWTVKLKFTTVESALILSELSRYSDSYVSALCSLLQDTMIDANQCGDFQTYAERILMLTKLDGSGVGIRWVRENMLRSLHEIGLRTEYYSQLPPVKICKKTLNGL